MTKQIAQESFKTALFDVFDEVFNQVKGIFLDKGTSLFETLDTITAEVASIPVGAKCASIAAQTDHVRFYIDILSQYMSGKPPAEKVDWKAIWLNVEAVTPEEWDAIKSRLRASYDNILSMMNNIEDWDEDRIGDALAITVHTAYHLGEIRQALCTVA